MAKSAKKTSTDDASEKSFFRSAGETIGTIAHEIVEGKNKLVETATTEFAVIKKAIKKKLKKKKAAVPKKKIKAAVKKTAKKIAVKTKKAAKKRKPAVKKSKKKTTGLKPRR